jgi:hypothetical protein
MSHVFDFWMGKTVSEGKFSTDGTNFDKARSLLVGVPAPFPPLLPDIDTIFRFSDVTGFVQRRISATCVCTKIGVCGLSR